MRAMTPLLVLGVSLRALAQPVGSEFQVNSFTTGSQGSAIQFISPLGVPAVAGGGGQFVVVWSSEGQDGGAGFYGGYGIFAQRYDSGGTRQGAEFQVNTATPGRQVLPAVGAGAGGDFVVVWLSEGPDGGDGWGTGVFGQRYDSAGAAQGGEFQVNTYTTGDQNSFPRPAGVAVAPTGAFLVVWMSDHEGDSSGVFGQRYDSTGAAQGGEFRVNTYTTGSQAFPAVAVDGSGNFVVVWQSGAIVSGQRYDSSGAAQGSEFQVNTTPIYGQMLPAVAADPAGNFVVTWTGDDGDFEGIFGRRYDSAGAPQGPDFQINTYTTSVQGSLLLGPSAVAADAAGNFAVVWGGEGNGDDWGVFGQRYDSSGAAEGGEFQVNTFTTSFQPWPAVAAAAGGFVATWASFGQDGSDFGVFAQRFAAVLPGFPIGAKVSVIKPAKLFKFVAKGTFTLPDPIADNPATEGGSLSFTGTTGGRTYTLPSACWKGLGPGRDGSRGFKCKDSTCRAVNVKEKVIKGVCRSDTGGFALPEPGPVSIVLTVGDTTRYCAQCGGTSEGNPDTIFKRKECTPPVACP